MGIYFLFLNPYLHLVPLVVMYPRDIIPLLPCFYTLSFFLMEINKQNKFCSTFFKNPKIKNNFIMLSPYVSKVNSNKSEIMEQIYNAEMINNQIFWLNDMPKMLNKDMKYNVRVIIENKEETERTGNDLIEFFRNSPLYGVELDLTRNKDYAREIEL